MNNNYFIIYGLDIRVPLLAQNDTYYLRYGNKVCEIPDTVERSAIYAQHVKGGDISHLCWWIRTYRDAHITASELDECVDNFQNDHPATALTNFSPPDVIYYATSRQDLVIPLSVTYKLKYDFTIGQKTEKEWMDIVCKYDGFAAARLKSHVATYRQKYGIDICPSGKWDQDEDIAVGFLKQHGLDPWGGFGLVTGEPFFGERRAKQAANLSGENTFVLYMVIATIASVFYLCLFGGEHQVGDWIATGHIVAAIFTFAYYKNKLAQQNQS